MASTRDQVRVLLVDDDAAFLEALCEALRDSSVTVVGTASSGEEALTQVDRLRPNVVVLDVLMPGIGGMETARLCRERHPDCRLILISGSIFHSKLTELAATAGVDRYLTKSEVLARLEPTILGLDKAAASPATS